MFKMNLNLILSSCLLALFITGCSSNKDKANEYDKYSTPELQQLAKQSLEKEDFKNAIYYLEGLEYKPDVVDREDLELNLIRSYYMNKDYDLGLAAAESFLSIHEKNGQLEHVDEVLYLRGMMYYNYTNGFLMRTFKQDMSKRDINGILQSYNDFVVIINQFPNSPYAKKAEEKARYIIDKLAERDFETAKFYYERGAYLATIRRIELMKENYGNTPSSKDALNLLEQAYEKLNMVQNQKAIEEFKKNVNSKTSIPKVLKVKVQELPK